MSGRPFLDDPEKARPESTFPLAYSRECGRDVDLPDELSSRGLPQRDHVTVHRVMNAGVGPGDMFGR